MSDHLINNRGTTDSHADGTEPAALDDSRLRGSLYRQMLLIRRFEERVYRLFLEGEIPGTLHQYQGQEAVAVGVCDVLTPDDWTCSRQRQVDALHVERIVGPQHRQPAADFLVGGAIRAA